MAFKDVMLISPDADAALEIDELDLDLDLLRRVPLVAADVAEIDMASELFVGTQSPALLRRVPLGHLGFFTVSIYILLTHFQAVYGVA